ncbi:hypothetical protein LPB303_16910 [Polaribacter atrinae]|uniref:Uncharacterized protein n=1 Tax=Polaribacter atrinae TaxID=1333662 RepID=A0A176SXA2_9FLAO|nr:hypothetical protein LPB303_16910 [Polaribacter atrinae]
MPKRKLKTKYYILFIVILIIWNSKESIEFYYLKNIKNETGIKVIEIDSLDYLIKMMYIIYI